MKAYTIEITLNSPNGVELDKVDELDALAYMINSHFRELDKRIAVESVAISSLERGYNKGDVVQVSLYDNIENGIVMGFKDCYVLVQLRSGLIEVDPVRIKRLWAKIKSYE